MQKSSKNTPQNIQNTTEFTKTNRRKSSENTPQNTRNHQKLWKLGQEGGRSSKFASQTPQNTKMIRKWRPRGDPWVPPRDPKIAKIVIKKNQTFIIFPNPVRERFLTILNPKMEPNWVKNEVSERTTRGKIKKTQNPKFAILSTKNTYFSKSKNMQNWEKPQKMHAENEAHTKVTLQKRFFMILPQFWDPPETLKAPKSS